VPIITTSANGKDRVVTAMNEKLGVNVVAQNIILIDDFVDSRYTFEVCGCKLSSFMRNFDF